MVARDASPDALANAALGDEHGGNVENAPPVVEEAQPVEVVKPNEDDKVKDDKPKPGPSGPGLRTTNTPTRRGR